MEPTQIKDRSIVSLAYRRRDGVHAINCQEIVSSIGRLDVIVNSIHLPKTSDEDDIIDERIFFELRKADACKDDILKYN